MRTLRYIFGLMATIVAFTSCGENELDECECAFDKAYYKERIEVMELCYINDSIAYAESGERVYYNDMMGDIEHIKQLKECYSKAK